MVSLAMAVVVASVLGSLHCVGMCGPLAMWASDTRRPVVSLTAYHLGRLTTYLSAGLAAGLLGSALTVSGEMAGLQSMAAKLAGGVLIVMGIARVWRNLPWQLPVPFKQATLPRPSRIAGLLHAAKPIVASQGPAGRGYLAGLLTTWLPCGWLYLFVLVAAGTGDIMPSLLVMTSFWIGTLPALTGLVLGAGTLMRRHPTSVAIAAGLLLIITGLYTATGRASADLASIVPPSMGSTSTGLVQEMSELTEQPLPCCPHCAEESP